MQVDALWSLSRYQDVLQHFTQLFQYKTRVKKTAALKILCKSGYSHGEKNWLWSTDVWSKACTHVALIHYLSLKMQSVLLFPTCLLFYHFLLHSSLPFHPALTPQWFSISDFRIQPEQICHTNINLFTSVWPIALHGCRDILIISKVSLLPPWLAGWLDWQMFLTLGRCSAYKYQETLSCYN